VDLKFHRTDDQLEQYALGRLAESERLELEEHLLICESCQARLDGIADFSHGMKEALEAQPPPAEAPRRDWFAWLRRPAISMALAFVALIAVMAVFSGGDKKLPPVSSLQLTALRGEMPGVSPAREIDLTLTDAPKAEGPFRVEVVNAMGLKVWNGLADSGPRGVEVKVQQQLSQGDYFVRMYSVTGQLLHEYGFHVHS
jgi:hypothetical protein